MSQSTVSLAATAVVVLHLLSAAQAQIIPEFLSFGYCPTAAPMKDLDLNKFAGTWFTIERIPNQYVATASCIYTNYTVDDTGLSTHEFGKNAAGEALVIQSKIKSNKPGEALTVVAQGVPEAPLKIVATDYDTYACLESCLQYPAFKAQFAWVLTKKPATSIEAAKTCKEILKEKMSIASTSFKKVKQGRGCDYPTWARGSE